jgi:long-subunit fatty acid transport protein
MAHYAFLDENNVVTEVITGIDETELIEGLDTETWYGNFRGQVCKRTSYNNNIRKQYAGVGFSYDSVGDVFVAPQPYSSWSLDENFDWQAPTPRPQGMGWYWDEDNLEWVSE